jgi:hypothetical protein
MSVRSSLVNRYFLILDSNSTADDNTIGALLYGILLHRTYKYKQVERSYRILSRSDYNTVPILSCTEVIATHTSK